MREQLREPGSRDERPNPAVGCAYHIVTVGAGSQRQNVGSKAWAGLGLEVSDLILGKQTARLLAFQCLTSD